MASLFKNKAIKEKLESFEISDIESKLDIIRKWHKAYTEKSLHAKTVGGIFKAD